MLELALFHEHRLEIMYSGKTFMSARTDAWSGIDTMTYCCTVSIISSRFAASVVERGIPAGK